MDKIEQLLLKSKALGLPIDTIETKCKNFIYLVRQDKDNNLLLIPNNVKEIGGAKLSKIKGNLRLLGGNNVTNASYLFYNSNLDYIDFNDFNAVNLRNVHGMFKKCRIKAMNIEKLKISNVINMSGMFSDSIIETGIDLSNMNINKVTDMNYIFNNCSTNYIKLNNITANRLCIATSLFKKCKAETIEINNFTALNLTNIHAMFCECKTKYINLNTFKSNSITNISNMFDMAEIDKIDINNISTHNVSNAQSVFYLCKAKEINLEGISLPKTANKQYMFSGCRANVKITDELLKDTYNYDKSTEFE